MPEQVGITRNEGSQGGTKNKGGQLCGLQKQVKHKTNFPLARLDSETLLFVTLSTVRPVG
jgi:hypothetical protein